MSRGKGTKPIVIDSLSKLEKALVDGQLISMAQGDFSHKTVSVSFQLRVPRKMRAGEIKSYLILALTPGLEPEVSVYKQRIEVFMP